MKMKKPYFSKSDLTMIQVAVLSRACDYAKDLTQITEGSIRSKQHELNLKQCQDIVYKIDLFFEIERTK